MNTYLFWLIPNGHVYLIRFDKRKTKHQNKKPKTAKLLLFFK